ncbi:MAG: alkaline phosphatase D family protein [Chitinophagales bacterium]
MKKVFYFLMIGTTIIMTACIPTGGGTTSTYPTVDPTKNISKIIISSCCYQTSNLSIYRKMQEQNADLYLAMGDNVYADNILSSPDYPGWIQAQYDLLKNNYDYNNFRNSLPAIATWDDHDFGQNNAGNTFPYKVQSKEKFMQFWQTPSTDQIRTHDGVYSSHLIGDAAHRIQIIVLDCRYFLDILSGEPISATTDTTKTILGATQWAWFRQQLLQPAKIRIIVSSTQFGTEHNYWETWANFPHEMEKFYQALRDAHAEGAFVVSGDVHYSEFSKRTPANLYPIYDFTSSGLTHTEYNPRPNQYRLGEAYRNFSFGTIEINWDANPVTIALQIRDNNGNVQEQQVVSLDELKF